jgi:hypothetical protein
MHSTMNPRFANSVHAMCERFKQVLNTALRKGLRGGERKPAKPFRQRTFDLGKPLVDLIKALSLAAELEEASTVRVAQRRASG